LIADLLGNKASGHLDPVDSRISGSPKFAPTDAKRFIFNCSTHATRLFSLRKRVTARAVVGE